MAESIGGREMMPKSEVFNVDCLEYMRGLPDSAFDLAIVDPPYRDAKDNAPTKAMRLKLGNMQKWADRPGISYFDQLFRISKNQIVWGLNHMTDLLRPTSGFICWYKHQNGNFSECEIAWTSFLKTRFFDRAYQLDIGNKIHPTQKPVALYKWLLTNYAKPDQTIFDSHLGSGSSRIAAYDLGFDFTACELDKDYFEAQERRFQDHIKQPKLFEPVPETEAQKQLAMFD
jgi:site-specific DNA-methyltransferase (adenine-specific)